MTAARIVVSSLLIAQAISANLLAGNLPPKRQGMAWFREARFGPFIHWE
jgi:hypothetical protein